MFLNDCTGMDAQLCQAINICQARVNNPSAGAPSPDVAAACKAVMDEYYRLAKARAAEQDAAVKRAQDDVVRGAAGAIDQK